MRQKLEKHLLEKILPFWMKLRDPDFGGFYSHVDSLSLNINPTGDKSLVQHARLLWTFSAMENHYKNGTYLKYAKQAHQFLVDYFEDKSQGGFYWNADYRGQVFDTRKVVYGQAFAIYGLSEFYRITKDEFVLKKAMKTFSLVEANAAKSEFGYWEEFNPGWQKTPCLILGDGVEKTEFTLNTTIHILEAYVNLYDVTKNELVGNSIKRLIDMFLNVYWNKKNDSLFSYLNQFGESLSNNRSYGHIIEASWLIDEACEKLELDRPEIRLMTKAISARVLEDAFKKGILADIHNGRIDYTQVWWVQSEALVGFYNQFEKTKDKLYYKAFIQTWKLIQKRLVDRRSGGEWFWSCATNKVKNTIRPMAEQWKTPYHNSRAILKIMERMDLHSDTSSL